MDADGDDWDCSYCRLTLTGPFFPPSNDVWQGQVVHPQGTYRFPYRSVGQAVTRARGVTPSGDPAVQSLRTGYGWTVLIKPGSYPETLTIDIPLTLKKFDDAPGIVVIGQ